MNDHHRGMLDGESETFEPEKAPLLVPAYGTGLPPYAGYGAEHDEPEAVHLRDYWRAVRKRLWMVLGLVLLATMLASLYVARQPDVYVAQARVQVDLETPGAVSSAKSQSVIINNPVSDPTYFNTQLQILTSPGLLRRVVKTLDLENNRSFMSAGR